MLFIEITFGIILDAFGSIRERNDQRKELEENYCYICGKSKVELENSNSAWSQHIYQRHNVYHMVYFLSRVKGEETEFCDLSAIER